MNYAITVGYDNAYSEALVVFRGVERNLPKIAQLGYDGIELALFNKSNVENVDRLKSILAQNDLRLPVISTGQIYTMHKVFFTHEKKEVRDKAVEVFAGIMELGAEFGADINISRVRGSIPNGTDREEGLSRLTSCLEPLCRKAETYGINLVLEQMNRYETNYFLRVDEIGDYIRESGLPRLKIHADTFHMNIEDADMPAVLDKYKELLGYIHFADSNRLSPGHGHIDFKNLLACLMKIEYQKWIGIEVFQQPDSYKAAKKSITFLREQELAIK